MDINFYNYIKFIFFLSFMTIGGATTILNELNIYLVQENQLIDNTTFFSLFSLAQSLPGPNVQYISLLTFYIYGFLSAIIISIIIGLPTGFSALLFYKKFHLFGDRFYNLLKKTFLPLSIALLASNGIIIFINVQENLIDIIFLILIITLSFSLKINPFIYIISGLFFGILKFLEILS